MSFAGFGNPPQRPPARGRHCAPVGGYMRREGAERREGARRQSWLDSAPDGRGAPLRSQLWGFC
jgi:hypothetical protein